jgi:hypothetical protein
VGRDCGETAEGEVMTDADLARQEWLDERAAVLEFEAKFPRDEAERLALVMWESKVQRENASAGHGDASGEIAGGADRAEAG